MPSSAIVGFIVAGLTAFYMARLMAMTFFGETRLSKEKLAHVHESPWVMLVPLVLLAVGSAQAQSISSSASYTLLHAPAGDIGGGGPVANAGSTVTAEISTGDPAAGTVSAVTPNGVLAKGNLVGQLVLEFLPIVVPVL